MMAELEAEKRKNQAESKALENERVQLKARMVEMENAVRMGKASKAEAERLRESMEQNEAEIALMHKKILDDSKLDKELRNSANRKNHADQKKRLQERLRKKQKEKEEKKKKTEATHNSRWSNYGSTSSDDESIEII